MKFVILVLLGLCFGSFVNALVYRLHEQKRTKKNKNLSVLHGRSMCVHCHHTLAWYDLLPVLSWLLLGGKCRYCKKPISAQYPIVELFTAGLFVLSYSVWPHGFEQLGVVLFSFWLVFLVGFMAMAVYDLHWMLLPDKLTYPLTALAVIQVLIHATMAQDFGVIANAGLGFLAVGGFFYILFQISKGKWIGGGDVKLGFLLGLLVGGFIEGLMVVFVASLIGTFAMAPLMIMRKQSLQKRIPFGPFLIAATIIVYMFSARIIDWYQTQLFLV
jgi:prepilin signal peptidase PulO-like enzyme (type II secretory pathway)